MREEWLNKLLENLKVGDLIVENHGSFKKSITYIVVEISEEKITCRLFKNEHSEKMLKTNSSYCSKDKVFVIDKLRTFPEIIKLNDGNRDTDGERATNLKKIF